MIEDWLQLFRAHTAPATILLITIPFLAGGGTLFSFQGILLILFAWTSHLTSFGHNSLMDFQGGWDKEDPHKQHHPLCRGVISLKQANNVIHTLLFVLAISGICLTFLGTGNQFYAVICLLLWIVAGHGYNDGLSKTLLPSFLPINTSIAFAGLFGYFLAAQEFSMFSLMIALYIFLTIWFETSIEGNLKEIQAREENLLVWMGAKCDGKHFHPGRYVIIYGFLIKLAAIYIAIVLLRGQPLWLGAIALIFQIMMIFLALLLMMPQKWNRRTILKYCALEEVLSIYLLCIILLPIIGYLEGLALMIGGIIYFYLFNKVEWGTKLTPMV